MNLLAVFLTFDQVQIQREFIAGTVIAMTAGIAGHHVLLRNQVFAGDALGHAAFTGAMMAAVAGLPPLAGVLGVTAAGGVVVALLGGSARGRDVVIGTVLAAILGVGALFLRLYTTTSHDDTGTAVLYGSIRSLSADQTAMAVVGGLGISAALLAMARPLLFASIDDQVAAARGVPVRTLGVLFMLLTGIAIAGTVVAVGAVLLLGLLVTPAAAAQRLTARPYVALALSAVLAVLATWTGLGLSIAVGWPPSVLIIGVAILFYALALVSSVRVRRFA